MARISMLVLVVSLLTGADVSAGGGFQDSVFRTRMAVCLDSKGRVECAWLTGPHEVVDSAIRELSSTEIGRHVASITISHAKITAKTILAMRPLQHLETLQIGAAGGAAETDVDEDAYEVLPALKGLKRLHLIATGGMDGTRNRAASLSSVKNMKMLEVLEIRATISSEDMRGISTLPRLRILRYDGNTDGIDNQVWARIAHMPSLRELRIERVRPRFSVSSTFSPASDIRIEALTLSWDSSPFVRRVRRWSGNDVRAISRISTLKALNLAGYAPLTEDQIAVLASLSGLEELSLAISGRVRSFPIVKSSRHLRKLAIWVSNGGSFDALRDLKEHAGITDLEILGNVDVDQIVALSEMLSLRRLHISGTDEVRRIIMSLDLPDVEVTFATTKETGE